MPRVYRSMFHDNGVPIITDSATGLGVRTGQSGGHKDIEVDGDGFVHPATGGMSVVPNWRLMKYYRIPMRLEPLCEGASGNNALACFAFGEGDFIAGPIHTGLALGSVTASHGCIEPETRMPLDNYRKALASTQSGWVIDES